MKILEKYVNTTSEEAVAVSTKSAEEYTMINLDKVLAELNTLRDFLGKVEQERRTQWIEKRRRLENNRIESEAVTSAPL